MNNDEFQNIPAACHGGVHLGRLRVPHVTAHWSLLFFCVRGVLEAV